MRIYHVFAVTLATLLLAWTVPALGQDSGKSGAKKKGAKAPAVKLSGEVKEAAKLLDVEDDEKKLDGIAQLAALKDPSAAVPLINLLKAGQRDKVTHAAIDALGAISSPLAIPILVEHMKHRRAEVRVLAINAISEIKNPQVIEALKNALRDSDPVVRKTAALALGRYGDQSAVEVLFKAFDRNVAEAAIAIGQIGNLDDMKRLATYLGKSPLPILLPGFAEFLIRPDFSEKGKLEIIEKLKELAGPEVKQFLIKFVAGLMADYPAAVKKKAEEAIKSIAD